MVEKPQWNDNVYNIPKPKPEIPINRHPDKTHIQPITKHMATASHHSSGDIPGIKELGKTFILNGRNAQGESFTPRHVREFGSKSRYN